MKLFGFLLFAAGVAGILAGFDILTCPWMAVSQHAFLTGLGSGVAVLVGLKMMRGCCSTKTSCCSGGADKTT